MLLPKAPAAPEPEAPPAAAPGPAAAAGGAPAAPEPASTGRRRPAAPEVRRSRAEPAPARRREVAATAIVRADGVEVVPPAGDPGAARKVTLASISYAEAGQVTLAGVGTAGAVLRAYVDDRFAQEAKVGADGRWAMDLGGRGRGHLPAAHRPARPRRQGGEPGRDAVPARLSAARRRRGRSGPARRRGNRCW